MHVYTDEERRRIDEEDAAAEAALRKAWRHCITCRAKYVVYAICIPAAPWVFIWFR